MPDIESGKEIMAEFFAVDASTVYSTEPVELEIVLEANDKLKNKGGDDLDEILERKCPSGKRLYFHIVIHPYAIVDV